jgi:hypothetical protein
VPSTGRGPDSRARLWERSGPLCGVERRGRRRDAVSRPEAHASGTGSGIAQPTDRRPHRLSGVTCSAPRRGHPPLPVRDARNRQLLREVVELVPFVVSAVRRRLGDLGECEEAGNYSTGVDLGSANARRHSTNLPTTHQPYCLVATTRAKPSSRPWSAASMATWLAAASLRHPVRLGMLASSKRSQSLQPSSSASARSTRTLPVLFQWFLHQSGPWKQQKSHSQ